MRRQLVAQVARRRATALGHLPTQLDDFLREPVNQLLLAVDGHVELVQQVFGEAGLDLQAFEPFDDSPLLRAGLRGRFHRFQILL